MTTPRRALPAASPSVPDAAPRHAITPTARPRLARTLTASALVVGVAATTGQVLLRPPAAPTAYVAVAAVTTISDAPEATTEPPATSATSAAAPASSPATTTTVAAAPAPAAPSTSAPRPSAAPAVTRSSATVRAAAAPTSTAPARSTSSTSATPARTTTAAPATSASSTAANAVTAQVAAYARAHIGYPYQVGTKGPDVFDCAGLVTAAFASAGVTVRHSMTAQAALGSYVSRENLRPGDLVIWGDPVSAVSIYIGNDTIVIGDGPAYGVRTVTVTERLKYRSFQGGRRYTG